MGSFIFKPLISEEPELVDKKVTNYFVGAFVKGSVNLKMYLFSGL